MRRLLNHIYNASLVLAAFFIIGIFLLMIGESAFRKLGSYITGANELVGWFCAAAGFLALPATFKRGDMVRVGFIVDRMPALVRKPVLIGCLLVALVFVSYMVYSVTGYLWSGWRSEETSQGMIEIAVQFLVGRDPALGRHRRRVGDHAGSPG
jgi:TRAP-type C4-dicarboxylate transport system permease small subunit